MKRFGFGQNWINFSKAISENEIAASQQAIMELLSVQNLAGKKLLDIGSGSGLSTIAAKRLGAEVIAFDYDVNSVQATCNNIKKFEGSVLGKEVQVLQGSVLDLKFLQNIEKCNIYYSWGVLHHTGNMYLSYLNLSKVIESEGILAIAIYNDQGIKSKLWWVVKYLYNNSPILRIFIIAFSYWYFVPLRRLYNFFKRKQARRGMNLYFDMLDWLGGFPFETESPRTTVEVFNALGFDLIKQKNVGNRLGCNEFVFKKR